MRSIACNTLILPDGTEHRMAVATFADDGTLISWRKMNGEEAFVEWHKGTLNLTIRPHKG